MFGRLLLAAALALALPVHSQSYPSRPIKVIVPFPPGASTDILARIVGERLLAQWGQPVTVENKAGAAGNLGAEAVFKAEPDGYTLLVAPPPPLVINQLLYSKLAYVPQDFAPVSVIAKIPTVLAVNPKVQASSVQELIALAKANPGRLNYASQGSGSTGHLTGELLASMTGIKIVHVPYKGASPALTDLVAGRVDMFFMPLAEALALIRSGQIKALAVASEKRSTFLPNVPAMSETLPGFISVAWFAMVAPPKTPREITNRLSAAIAEILKQPAIAKRLADMNAEPIGNSPAEMAVFLREEIERWGSVARSAGAKAD